MKQINYMFNTIKKLNIHEIESIVLSNNLSKEKYYQIIQIKYLLLLNITIHTAVLYSIIEKVIKK